MREKVQYHVLTGGRGQTLTIVREIFRDTRPLIEVQRSVVAATVFTSVPSPMNMAFVSWQYLVLD